MALSLATAVVNDPLVFQKSDASISEVTEISARAAPPSGGGLSVGAIVGIAVGVVLLAGIAIFVVVFVLKRKRRNNDMIELAGAGNRFYQPPPE